MADNTIDKFVHNDSWAHITITSQSIAHAVARYLQENARRILTILWIACVLISIISCLVIEGGSLGYPGVVTPQSETSSGYNITATYGAQMFYQQLTAVATEKNP